MKTKFLLGCLALLTAVSSLAAPLGTAFTYQGRLTDGGVAASGLYDLRFAIYDSLADGSVVGGPLTNSATAVSNGLFTVPLDFGGGVFTGAARWLDIAVRTNGSGADFTSLNPRQPLTPAPYAVMAGNVGAGGVAGAYTNAVSFNNAANSFAGNGAALANVNAATLGGLTAASFWQLGGSAGTTPGTHFLGTTDNQALEFKVNGVRALRLEPNASNEPSVIGGAPNNFIATGVRAAIIAGGKDHTIQDSASVATIGGGWTNTIQFNAQGATIAGGIRNVIQSAAQFSTIAGGEQNTVEMNAQDAVVSGGIFNLIHSNADYSTVGGGFGNVIQTNITGGTIAGGYQSAIGVDSDLATIGGGYINRIDMNAPLSTIAGGQENSIQADAQGSTIAGGIRNQVGTLSSCSAIGGGSNNVVRSGSRFSSVGGGESNEIAENTGWATIAGGRGHDIGTNCYNSTIGGGWNNNVADDSAYATIGGGARNDIGAGVFVGTIGGGWFNNIRDMAWYGTIAGGQSNSIASFSMYATVAGGSQNGIGSNSTASVVGGGQRNSIAANSVGASIAGGAGNVIQTNADYATIPGGRYGKASHYGQLAYASGQFAAAGDAQSALYVLRRTTSNATQSELFLDGASLRMTVPNGATWTFEALVAARSSTGDSAGYRLIGVVENVGSAMAGTVQAVQVLREDVAAWDVSATTDNVNDALIIQVTGAAGATIRWVASVRTAEVSN